MTSRCSSHVLMPAIVPIAMVFAFAVAVAGLSRPVSSSGLVATVFPPWWTEAQSIRAAARVGSVAAVGAVPFVLVVAADTPADIQDLRRAGAWLVFDPSLLPICGAPRNGGDQT